MFESILSPRSFSTPKRPLSCAQNVSCHEWKSEHSESPHIDRSCLHGQLSRDAKARGLKSPLRPFRLPTELLIPPPAFSSIITTPLTCFSHHDLAVAARAASIQDVAKQPQQQPQQQQQQLPPSADAAASALDRIDGGGLPPLHGVDRCASFALGV